jgi:radical SAM superfamily enzyme YgiQ (UPF0313 family)
MIPLGIASIAAVLESHNYTVKIVDFNHYKGDYQKDLQHWKPKIIGIGGTTSTRKNSFLTAQLSKEVLPDVPVVYGGVHATFTAEDTLTHIPHIDLIVRGEGEYTFLMLCHKFVRGHPVDIFTLDGLCYRYHGGIVEKKHTRIDNLKELPIPARHLFEYDYTMTLDYKNIRADFLMTSRGCLNGCSFCSESRMFPGGIRLRNISQIQQEIEHIVSHKNIKGLKLFDSTFTADRNHVVNFCTMVRPCKLQWECSIRADTVDRDLLLQMKSAGCCYINVGLETTNERLLKKIGKNITVNHVESVLEWCKKIDIKTKVFFTFGHLGETYRECLEDIKYIRKKREMINFYATTAGVRVYPGTRLEKELHEKNYLAPNFSWAKFKPPLKNLLLLEPGDTLILEQKKLSLLLLSTLILKLCLQGTVLSRNYIRKTLWNNVTNIFTGIRVQIRNMLSRVQRMVNNKMKSLQQVNNVRKSHSRISLSSSGPSRMSKKSST